MTPIPLTVSMVIEPAASEAFPVLECDPGDAHLLSPKEKKSACNEAAQTKPEVGVLSWDYIWRAARTGLYHGVRQINSKGKSSTDHTLSNRPQYHGVCRATPNNKG